MKAKKKHRVNLEKHVNLGEVVPLETPYVLLMDPSNLCNLRCKFCPTGNLELIRGTGRHQGNMDFGLFKKIIDDLNEFDKPIKVLRLYKEGEPLVNKAFPDMVAYAKKSGKVLRIDTTTNGLLLTPELNRRIIAAGLDQINISVNGMSNEQIFGFTRVRVDFKKYVDNIRDLCSVSGGCEVCVKAIKENLSAKEQEEFYGTFGDIADRVFLENLSPAWPEFKFDGVEMKFSCGNYGQEIVQRKVCPYIFYIMVINSDGSASLCVGDWKHTLKYGDLRKESVKALWNGAAINRHRIAQLKGLRGEIPFCGSCQVVSHGTLDNLDGYAKEILARMKP